jgi:ribose/xylose/arabinose/galactoside ABC-type transport system permease subunit
METILAWMKALPATLATVLDIVLIAVVFMTSVTLLTGMWIGFCIARKRMNQIAEIEFFPPKITFKDKEKE